MFTCSTCGKDDIKNLGSHERMAHGGGVAVAERPEEGPRSQRARRQREGTTVRTIDQIPVIPGSEPGSPATGAWCYYLRSDGDTIPEILIVQPNGGIPDIADERMKGRYGTNASYYRERYAAKGIEYLGSKLTEEVMRKVVRVLAANREEAILFCQDEIDECDDVIRNSDLPEVRAQYKRRRAAFGARLATLQQPFDVDAVLSELNDIARAYQLSKLDPNLLSVLKSMLGEQDERMNARMQEYAAHFQRGGDTGLEKARPAKGANPSDLGAGFSGEDFIDRD